MSSHAMKVLAQAAVEKGNTLDVTPIADDHDGCTMHRPCDRCRNAPPPIKCCCFRMANGWHCMLDDGHEGDHQSPPPRPLASHTFEKGKVK